MFKRIFFFPEATVSWIKSRSFCVACPRVMGPCRWRTKTSPTSQSKYSKAMQRRYRGWGRVSNCRARSSAVQVLVDGFDVGRQAVLERRFLPQVHREVFQIIGHVGAVSVFLQGLD